MIAFASRTGNVRYIVSELNLPSVEIVDGLIVNEPFFIFTYTDKLGEVPVKVSNFLKDNHMFCKGVICSGNSNFGHNNFCYAANRISEQYHVPIIRKIELRGFPFDYQEIIRQYNKLIKGIED